jgi:hypothetical protein
MTFVGYNDEIKYDFNGDGLFTNDIDINNDGIFDMRDWEIGALKIANSWGESSFDDGYVYMPYKLCGEPSTMNGQRVYILTAKEDNIPGLTVKAKVDYPYRKHLKFFVGYANNANQTNPIESDFYYSFSRKGGGWPMQGINDNPIEVGLDFDYWYHNEDVGKIYFIIDENDNLNLYDGIIEYFSIIDYRWGEVFELYCDESNVSIINADETVLSIDYDLIPHEASITEFLSLFSNMVSRFAPSVENNATLTVEDGVRIDMYDSEIHIDAGSSLVLEDNVTFLAKTGSCKLIIDGDITIGSNVSFIAEPGAEMEVLLSNTSLQVTFNYATFEKSMLNSYAQSLTIENSVFNNCNKVHSHCGNVTIARSNSFNRTGLYLENTIDNNDKVIVSDCYFTTDNTLVAIDLWNYKNYDISNNTIDGYFNGIQLMQSGYGLPKNQTLQDNTITNSGYGGIMAYNSLGAISRNHIYNNEFGVWIGNHSSMSLKGNSSAESNDETQEIIDNDSYEVYASQYSFPTYFRYNVIIDEDNLGGSTDALVYHSSGIGGIPIYDVRYNCWGQNFDPAYDLYPIGYIWQPVWCPSTGSEKSLEMDEDMYETAINLFDTKDYPAAKNMYEMLIEQYPESKFAKAAMQELFALEKFASNNYGNLKQYYQTNAAIQSVTHLAETGEYLATKCEVKLENWSNAISYHEGIILNPESLEDSIFAIIDLGYVYFVMDNSGQKSACTGNLIEHKPESKEKFTIKRDYLLSLIPGDQMSETMKWDIAGLNEGELLQNVPNPFSATTQIWYKLENESTIQMNIYNYTGKLIESFNEGTKTKGTHRIDFDASGLKNGIYFYSISINGKTTDSKKMTIMK